MVLVTLACLTAAWLGYERSVVMERRAMRARLEKRGARFDGPFDPFADPFLRPQNAGQLSVPWIRRWLGDEPIAQIEIVPPDAFSPREAAAIGQRFPEAMILRETPSAVSEPTDDPMAPDVHDAPLIDQSKFID